MSLVTVPVVQLDRQELKFDFTARSTMRKSRGAYQNYRVHPGVAPVKTEQESMISTPNQYLSTGAT